MRKRDLGRGETPIWEWGGRVLLGEGVAKFNKAGWFTDSRQTKVWAQVHAPA